MNLVIKKTLGSHQINRIKRKNALFFIFVIILIFVVCIQINILDEQKSSTFFLIWKVKLWIWNKISNNNIDAQCNLSNYYLNKNIKDPNYYERTLVVQINDKSIERNTWWSISAALNLMYIQSIIKYNNNNNIIDYKYIQLIPPKGNQRRAWLIRKNGWRLRTGHWARINIMKKLIIDYPIYDHYLYIDADVVFNHHYIKNPPPVNWFLKTCIHSNLNKEIIFFSNAPREPHMPCSGIFFISPNRSTTANNLTLNFLDKWWQYNSDIYFDSHSEYDQHALHEFIYKYPDIVSLFDIKPFVITKESWVYHFSKNVYKIIDYSKQIIHTFKIDNALTLDDIVDQVKHNNTMKCYYNNIKEGPFICK